MSTPLSKSHRAASRRRIRRRDVVKQGGAVFVLFAVLLVPLLAMVGLVVDTGLLMAAQRQSQNAADAAAMAAAFDRWKGESVATATATATAYVTDYNGLTGTPDPVVNIPPVVSAAYGGDPDYVEVIVTNPVPTYFIHVLPGFDVGQTVSARAVAGYEHGDGMGEGVIALDCSARPGLSIKGGSSLTVEGAVIVNSEGGGEDQWGQPIEDGWKDGAVSTNNSTFESDYLYVNGGVNNAENFLDTTLYAGTEQIIPDPLAHLPVPTNSMVGDGDNVGIDFRPNPPIKVEDGEMYTFTPGVYEDIDITNGATVTFEPGVYIMAPTGPQQGLRINGGPTVTGLGAMFYFTGDNYLDSGVDGAPGVAGVDEDGDGYVDFEPGTDGILGTADDVPDRGELMWPGSDDRAGQWDYADGEVTQSGDCQDPVVLPPPDPNWNQVDFAYLDLNFTNADAHFTGVNDPNSPWTDMLFFFRRRIGDPPQQGSVVNAGSLQGSAGDNVTLDGTIYAKWAEVKLAGQSVYDSQFVVGTLTVEGQADVTIRALDESLTGGIDIVYLVE
jgi:hypothetical protein